MTYSTKNYKNIICGKVTKMSIVFNDVTIYVVNQKQRAVKSIFDNFFDTLKIFSYPIRIDDEITVRLQYDCVDRNRRPGERNIKCTFYVKFLCRKPSERSKNILCFTNETINLNTVAEGIQSLISRNCDDIIIGRCALEKHVVLIQFKDYGKIGGLVAHVLSEYGDRDDCEIIYDTVYDCVLLCKDFSILASEAYFTASSYISEIHRFIYDYSKEEIRRKILWVIESKIQDTDKSYLEPKDENKDETLVSVVNKEDIISVLQSIADTLQYT